MCDDLGWGDVGFNGNKIIRTPHLDAMAKAGLKFNRFYAAAPVCSPAGAASQDGTRIATAFRSPTAAT